VKRSSLLPGLLLAFAAALIAAAPGCSRQGEGERCDTLNGDEDCNSGLVCVGKAQLGQNSDTCCPASLVSTDRRCVPVVGGTTSGGDTTTGTGGGTGGTSSGTGGTGGTMTGTGGSTSSGTGGTSSGTGGGTMTGTGGTGGAMSGSGGIMSGSGGMM
jgi:hypothetical protein